MSSDLGEVVSELLRSQLGSEPNNPRLVYISLKIEHPKRREPDYGRRSREEMIATHEEHKKRDEEKLKPLKEYFDGLKINYTFSAGRVYVTLNSQQVYELAERADSFNITRIRSPDEDPRVIPLEKR